LQVLAAVLLGLLVLLVAGLLVLLPLLLAGALRLLNLLQVVLEGLPVAGHLISRRLDVAAGIGADGVGHERDRGLQGRSGARVGAGQLLAGRAGEPAQGRAADRAGRALGGVRVALDLLAGAAVDLARLGAGLCLIGAELGRGAPAGPLSGASIC